MSAPIRTRRKWTAEEDLALCCAAEIQMREGSIKCWNEIASNIPNRTNKDCRKRWNRIGKNIKKGPWSKEEDKALHEAVRRFGLRWTLIAEAIGGRYADQCAKRWHHSLDPSLDRSDWSKEEDARLIEAVKVCGQSWRVIAEKEFSLRSTTAIKNRYYILTRRWQTGSSSSREEKDATQAGNEVEDENASDDDSDDENDFEILSDENYPNLSTGSSVSPSPGPGTPNTSQTSHLPNTALPSIIEFDPETLSPANFQPCSNAENATFPNTGHISHNYFMNYTLPIIDPLDGMDMDWNTSDLLPLPTTSATHPPNSIDLYTCPADLSTSTLDTWFFTNDTHDQTHQDEKIPQDSGNSNSSNKDVEESGQNMTLKVTNISSSTLYTVMDVLMKSRTKFKIETQ